MHTAVGMGARTATVRRLRKGKPLLRWWPTGGDLCAKCHEIKKDPVIHGPYKAGQCLICHNPHTSAYPGQLAPR